MRDNDGLVDDDVRRTRAEIMGEGREREGEIRGNRLELLDETIDRAKELRSLECGCGMLFV